jgi:hypothetical protein
MARTDEAAMTVVGAACVVCCVPLIVAAGPAAVAAGAVAAAAAEPRSWRAYRGAGGPSHHHGSVLLSDSACPHHRDGVAGLTRSLPLEP